MKISSKRCMAMAVAALSAGSSLVVTAQSDCNICGEGNSIGSNDALVTVTNSAGNEQQFTCSFLQTSVNLGLGVTGIATADLCDVVLVAALAACECTAPDGTIISVGDIAVATDAPVEATDAPVAEATDPPATEAPVEVTDAPTETPATDAPTAAPTETPATDAPTDAPVEATEAPMTETPMTEAPMTEAPMTEAPMTETPMTEAPMTEAPALTTDDAAGADDDAAAAFLCNICGGDSEITMPDAEIQVTTSNFQIETFTCQSLQDVVNVAVVFPVNEKFCAYLNTLTGPCMCSGMGGGGENATDTTTEGDEDTMSGGEVVTIACNGECTTFTSLEELNQTIADATEDTTLCLCPATFADDACPSDASMAAITIGGDKTITLECVEGGAVAGTETDCFFNCPNTIFHVASGAMLHLHGESGSLVLSGGEVYSRMVVEEGGMAMIHQVEFINTAAATADDVSTESTTTGEDNLRKRRRNNRHLQMAENADGNGGAISTMGNVSIYETVFENCQALFNGGAIYGTNTSSTYIYNSTFKGNTADVGAAIYSAGYVYLQYNTFDEFNLASAENGQIIKGPEEGFVLEGCDNTGLGPSKSCSEEDAEGGNGTSTSSAMTTTRISHMLFTSLLGATATIAAFAA